MKFIELSTSFAVLMINVNNIARIQSAEDVNVDAWNIYFTDGRSVVVTTEEIQPLFEAVEL